MQTLVTVKTFYWRLFVYVFVETALNSKSTSPDDSAAGTEMCRPAEGDCVFRFILVVADTDRAAELSVQKKNSIV
jgi:hypothetical protein